MPRASCYAVINTRREFAEAGGLMSYGAIADAWRQAFAVPPTLLARADEVIVNFCI